MAKSRHAKQIARNKRRQAYAALQISDEDGDFKKRTLDEGKEDLLLADLEPQHEVSQFDVEVLLQGKGSRNLWYCRYIKSADKLFSGALWHSVGYGTTMSSNFKCKYKL